MNVTHISGNSVISKDVDHPVAFILVNNRKDFVTFYDSTQSRYEGFFAAHGDTFVKTVSRITRHAVPDCLEVYHGEQAAALRSGAAVETYSLIQDEPVLIYENVVGDSAVVRLDMRDQFYIPQWGRIYDVREDGQMIVVRYHDDRLTDPVFLAILHDGVFHPFGSWVRLEYQRDKQRHSEPSLVYEYDLGEFTASKLIFAFGASEDDAVGLAMRYADFSKAGTLLSDRMKRKEADGGAGSASRKIAKACAGDALDALFIENRMLAGMPWFTKAWVRDELISLPALPESQARAVVSKYLAADWSDGKFPVIFGGHNYCSDGLGLLCWAILFSGLPLSRQEKGVLAAALPQAIEALEAMENEHGFIPSGERESWMDSIERTGYPIETQALYSRIIYLAELLTGSSYYKKKRLGLLKSIRAGYFVDGYLHDRLDDATIRPNLFLTALFEPAILSKAEWETCFDVVLPALWLEWGGLSSIDTNHAHFCDISTGERDISYHNGDSWFFVNNIAALVMQNINARKYADYINAIHTASTEEILWHNYIGRPGEISSACMLDSWGCGLQGFSAAAYAYLARRVPIKRRIDKRLFISDSPIATVNP